MICEICKTKEAQGSVGSLKDPTFIIWVCKYCYTNVLHMRDAAEMNDSLVEPDHIVYGGISQREEVSSNLT
jgi:hypothetical protein